MKKTLFILCTITLLMTSACSNTRYISCNCNCNCCNDETNNNSSNNKSNTKTDNTDINSSSDDETGKVEINNDFSYKETESPLISETEEDKQKKIEQRVYKKAKKLYLSGEWDGLPTTLDNQKISFYARVGHLNVNDHMIESELIDLPEDFDFMSTDSNIEYIPGYGFYGIKDEKLVMFSRGNKIYVDGNTLACKGLLKKKTYEYPRESDSHPYLYYDEESDTLILVTSNIDDNSIHYIYTFKNHDTSDVNYLGEYYDYAVIYDGKSNTFYCTDGDGIEWYYTDNGLVKRDLENE